MLILNIELAIEKKQAKERGEREHQEGYVKRNFTGRTAFLPKTYLAPAKTVEEQLHESEVDRKFVKNSENGIGRECKKTEEFKKI